MDNILIIEDEEKVSEIQKEYLQKEGYSVYCTTRGLPPNLISTPIYGLLYTYIRLALIILMNYLLYYDGMLMYVNSVSCTQQ